MIRNYLLCMLLMAAIPALVSAQGHSKTYNTALTANEDAVAAKRIILDDGFNTNGYNLTTEIDPGKVTAFTTSTADKKWVQTIAYGEDGRVLGNSVSYSDQLGKGIQTVSQIMGEEDKVMTSQTIYDDFGRPWVSTFPVPVEQTNMNFVTNLVDTNQLLTEGTITPTSKTGWYYSDSNHWEPYVPADQHAYTKVEHSKTMPAASYGYMAGDATHHLYSQTYTVAASPDEFRNHSLAGILNLESLKLLGDDPLDADAYLGMTKVVSIGVDGKESITYVDKSGNAVASCMSATGSPFSTINARYYFPMDMGPDAQYIDIHLPGGEGAPSSYHVAKSASWGHKIINLANDADMGTYNKSIYLAPGCYRIYCYEEFDSIAYVDIDLNYKYYSFSAYDKGNRLVRTLSPKDAQEIWEMNGSTPITSAGLNKRLSSYKYNALGQMLSSYSQDEGKTEYLYRRDGKIRFSQNAQQRIDGKFSYTKYDKHGRIIEVGEYHETTGSTTFATASSLVDVINLAWGMNGDNSNSHFQTFTSYGHADPDFPVAGRTQENLRGNISKTWNDNAITWYSYTYDGKVDFIIQCIKGLDLDGNGTCWNDAGIAPQETDCFTMDYEYDFSSKVIAAIFQKGWSDEFAHLYSYNFDGRLESVQTQHRGGPIVQQAIYEYYLHGPLKRKELGGNIQGVDYVYNINNLIKSINHPDLDGNDMGQDGKAGTAHANFLPDAFGMALDYYENDYSRTGTNIGNAVYAGTQYDGNINMQRWNTAALPKPVSTTQHAYYYRYDERNYMANAYYGSTRTTDGSFNEDANGAYSVYGDWIGYGIQYDANGNIIRLSRNKANGIKIDNFTYNYKTGLNQLDYVDDPAGNGGAGDLYGQSAENYTYNAIGQLTSNVQDHHSFEYDVYGKTTSIQLANDNSKHAYYTYDDRGFRIKKTVVDGSNSKTTYYARDLSGNILAIYTKENTSTLNLSEMPVYGSSRLGLAVLADASIEKYNYEMRDQVGNVRAVLSSISTPDNMDWISATNYYPGGMAIEDPAHNLGNYRFGYQGEFTESDKESGFEQFEARLYDSRINRWNTIDAAKQFWSPYLSMSNNWVSHIDPDGNWAPIEKIINWVSGKGFHPNEDIEGNFAVDSEGNRININIEEIFVTVDHPLFIKDPFSYMGRYSPPAHYMPSDYRTIPKINKIMKSPLIPNDIRTAYNAAYSVLDAAYIWGSAIINTPTTASNLEGYTVSKDEVTLAAVETMTAAISSTKLLKARGLNCAEFSKLTKGTPIARLNPQLRGSLNRTLNKKFWVDQRKNMIDFALDMED